MKLRCPDYKTCYFEFRFLKPNQPVPHCSHTTWHEEKSDCKKPGACCPGCKPKQAAPGRPSKSVYDPCQEKVISGKDRPCYEKRGAACRKGTGEWNNCDQCRYWPKKLALVTALALSVCLAGCDNPFSIKDHPDTKTSTLILPVKTDSKEMFHDLIFKD